MNHTVLDAATGLPMSVGGAKNAMFVVFLTHDTTRTYYFSLESLPVSARGYDATTGALVTETRGPDRGGNYFMNTYGYDTSGRITTESGWVKQ